MHSLSPIVTCFIVFAALFGAALAGFRLRRRLPDHHLSEDTKDAVRIAMASVATMAALVLGLLVASTKEAYDTERNEIFRLAAKITYLDQLLANCGPASAESRGVLRDAVRSAILRMWPNADVHRGDEPPARVWSQGLPIAIQRIQTSDDAQRAFKLQAATLANEVGQMRWMLHEEAESSISAPFLIMMVFWIALTFISVGLFAPPNATAVTAQFLAALSIAGALFLILELDQPFSGWISISNRPMVEALSQIGK